MTMTGETTTVARPFRRGLGIGLSGQVLIFLLMVGGLALSTRIGDGGLALLAAFGFVPFWSWWGSST